MKAAPLIGISRRRLNTDKEGVITLVTFHGCPLRYRHCLNPQPLHSEDVWEHYGCGQLHKKVKQGELYFLAAHGGIIFRGGESCLQNDFIDEFRQLRGQEWQLPVETSLNVAQENIRKLVPAVDSHVIDTKDINNAIYQKYIRKDNEKVLHNLQCLIGHGENEQIIVRTPVIPAYNTKNDVNYSIHLLREMGITQFDRFTYKAPNDCQP